MLNTNQVICTVDKKQKFEAKFEVRIGRGFFTEDENKRADMPLGVIPIDSIFSPVIRVKYSVENTRVGQRTDYDKLILEIWTDGRITPDDALLQASAILRHHLDVFVNYDDGQIEFDETPEELNQENTWLKKLLNMSVNDIELSVRATNCHMQKALFEMNVQLSNVISDITGESGLRIIEAILAGERDSEQLAALCSTRIKASRQTVAKSLHGNWDETLLFV